MSGDETLFRVILENVQDGVYMVDLERRIRYWSPGAEQLSGFSSQQVVGRCCSDNILMHVDESGRYLCQDGCPLQHSMDVGQRVCDQIYMHHAEGHRVPVQVRCAPLFGPDGVVVGAVETFSDASGEAAARERAASLEKQALLDSLTGLANRRQLEAVLAGALARQARDGVTFAVLMADVDHFKDVNDRYGHATGDRVLRLIARTLAGNVRPYDVAGRWGGEEFLLVMHGLTAAGLKQLGERLRALVTQSRLQLRVGATAGAQVEAPHDVLGTASEVSAAPLSVTVSLGATLSRPDDTSETLVGRADALLYQAKHAGRNRLCYEK